MATAAEIATYISNLEAEIGALSGAHDFESESPGGGRTAVSGTAEMIKTKIKLLSYWKAQLWKANGCPLGEPARAGVDTLRDTSNEDDAG